MNWGVLAAFILWVIVTGVAGFMIGRAYERTLHPARLRFGSDVAVTISTRLDDQATADTVHHVANLIAQGVHGGEIAE